VVNNDGLGWQFHPCLLCSKTKQCGWTVFNSRDIDALKTTDGLHWGRLILLFISIYWRRLGNRALPGVLRNVATGMALYSIKFSQTQFNTNCSRNVARQNTQKTKSTAILVYRCWADHTIPSTSEVSRCCIKSRMKPISLRALSNMTCGSSESQRRQFGAITIARLLASILVTAAISGDANFCRIKHT